MIGRAAEAARVDELIAAARAGESGAMLVLGDPGIGKTALLRYTRDRADGALLLRAGGSESEAHLAFAGLADLLGPVLDRVDQIPPPQADALRGALGLGPPAPGDRFTTYAGTLSLLAAVAETGSLVCVVDDAHWLDPESLEALLFVGRRLGAEGLALVLAAREGVSPRTDAAALPRLRLGGLDRADARELVARHAALEPAPAVLDQLLTGAAGNPMALIELAGSLSAGQLQGIEPLPDPLPVGPYLAEALLRPLEALPEPTRKALLLAAADDGAGPLPIALEAAGLEPADLEPAERAGVIRSGPTRTVFSHPLVRAAVYQAASFPDRRAAHRAHAAAAATNGDAAALDRRAWHLALASAGADEATAAELEAAAGRAAARSGYAAASEALEASARLSTGFDPMGRRLLAAGQSALAAGAFTRAARLFDEVVALDASPQQTLEALALRGLAEMFGGLTRRAIDMLVAAADRTETASPPAAAALLVQAVVPCFMRMDLRRAGELTGRAAALGHDGPSELRTRIDVATTITRIYRAEPVTLDGALVAELARLAASGDPSAAPWYLGAMQCLMVSERYDEALAGLDAVIAGIRARSTPSGLPWPLAARAEVRRRTGRFREATADASEAMQLADDTGQETLAGYAAGILAMTDALVGREEDCRAHARRATAASDESDTGSVEVFAHYALGLLALCKGEPEKAIAYLVTVERIDRDIGGVHPLVHATWPNLIEARIRAGEVAEATAALSYLEQQVETTGARWPAAAAARCRGLMAPDDEFEEHFARALQLHGSTPTPFQRARTLLCLGERRRRARRVREAREVLEEALETFEWLGTAPWAEWARRELQAAGARLRAPRSAATEALTPQELQVALAVSEGATNKEAAAALLISPKTVEYHLGHVYSKLGVRTRAELAHRMAAG